MLLIEARLPDMTRIRQMATERTHQPRSYDQEHRSLSRHGPQLLCLRPCPLLHLQFDLEMKASNKLPDLLGSQTVRSFQIFVHFFDVLKLTV